VKARAEAQSSNEPGAIVTSPSRPAQADTREGSARKGPRKRGRQASRPRTPNRCCPQQSERLFENATFADLDRGSGPLIVVTATDISSGARFGFNQNIFDVICSDLHAMPLSRAAAASSAVPFALSPVTLNNYGGTCKYQLPPMLRDSRIP
jgi:hypothetical protein